MEWKMCQNNLRETTSIQSLPEELKTKIFLELPMKDIFSVCLVCKQWNYIVMNNESVWKLRCYNLPEFLHKNFVNDRAQGHNWKVNTGILIYTMKINNCSLRQYSSNIWCELSTFFLRKYLEWTMEKMASNGCGSRACLVIQLPMMIFHKGCLVIWTLTHGVIYSS